jgi:hypothetical protein
VAYNRHFRRAVGGKAFLYCGQNCCSRPVTMVQSREKPIYHLILLRMSVAKPIVRLNGGAYSGEESGIQVRKRDIDICYYCKLEKRTLN